MPQAAAAKTNSLNACGLGTVATPQEEKHEGQFNKAQGQSRLTTPMSCWQNVKSAQWQRSLAGAPYKGGATHQKVTHWAIITVAVDLYAGPWMGRGLPAVRFAILFDGVTLAEGP